MTFFALRQNGELTECRGTSEKQPRSGHPSQTLQCQSIYRCGLILDKS
jgi:hypothetical protein